MMAEFAKFNQLCTVFILLASMSLSFSIVKRCSKTELPNSTASLHSSCMIFLLVLFSVAFPFSNRLLRHFIHWKTNTHFVSKYSRQTEYDFTMIGIITQSGKTNESLAEREPNGIKNACLNLVDKLTIVENVFLGRVDNECIIDPIAIYREL